MRQRFVWDKLQEKVVPIEERTDDAPEYKALDKFCYDRVDVQGETLMQLAKMEESGKMKDPKVRREAEILKRAVMSRPNKIVDYQKTGYPGRDS